VFDISFFGANFAKIFHGGWFPLLVAVTVFTLMSTWKKGRGIIARRMQKEAVSIDSFMADLQASASHRVDGTAVFMTGNLNIVPSALLHNLKHNQVLHRRTVILTVVTDDVPHVRKAHRYEMKSFRKGFYLLLVHFGFMDKPDLPKVLADIEIGGEPFRMMETTFFLGRETIIPADKPGMHLWRVRLFKLLARNARSATTYFDLPPNRVIELGTQIEM